MKLIIAVIIIFGLLVGYLQYNPSYKLSIEAKYYYTIGEYKIAYEIADKSLRLREYNTMAFHIKTRSGATIEVINFNKEAEEFLAKIKIIISKSNIARSDKLRSKMMSDVIISKYYQLKLPLVDDDTIEQTALKFFIKFKKINQQVIESLKPRNE